VAHADPVITAGASVGPFDGGEDHERALGGRQHVGAALGTGALLEQDELTALEVDAAPRQDGQDLKREVDVAVEVLVQGVPVALAVAQDQRRRPVLAGLPALAQQLLVLEREGAVLSAQAGGS
jgi:hypothetical protein